MPMFGSKHTTKELTKISSHSKKVAANTKNKASLRNKISIVSSAVMLAIMTVNMIMAADENNAISELGKIFDSLFKEVYKSIIAVSTIVAVAMVAVCLIIRMISKNQRSVDEATQWIKRILITWVILNGLMLFYNWAQQVAPGMGGTYKTE